MRQHQRQSAIKTLRLCVEFDTSPRPLAPPAQQIENILKAPAISLSAEQNGELDRVEAALLKNLSSKIAVMPNSA